MLPPPIPKGWTEPGRVGEPAYRKPAYPKVSPPGPPIEGAPSDYYGRKKAAVWRLSACSFWVAKPGPAIERGRIILLRAGAGGQALRQRPAVENAD